jgi:predicted ABC-type ATPase
LNLSSNYGLEVHPESFEKYLSSEGKSWQEKAAKENTPINIYFSDNNIVIKEGRSTAVYDAAIVADFIRLELLAQNNTFTFETVLSHPSNLEFLKNARQQGYKNYLYFVCTVSPAINIARVAQRVQLGGHNVPSDKIESRYYSSLALLSDLIPHTYHTYLFDNSSEGSDITLVAEIENGSAFIPKTEEIPWWVDEYAISKLFS